MLTKKCPTQSNVKQVVSCVFVLGVLAVGGAVGDGVLAVGEGVVGVGGAVVGGVVAGGAMVGDGLMYTGEQVVGGAGVVLDLMVPRQIKCRPAIFGSGLMFKRFRPQMSILQTNKVTQKAFSYLLFFFFFSFSVCLMCSKNNTSRGARTRDHGLKRPALYRLS